jgi:ElaB/YqjD/DUF883 family membrane-anchored ribosome-binding protein
MDTIRNTDSVMPSGCEVESATFHVPVEGGLTVESAGRGGLRGKLDDLKWRGAQSLHSLQDRGSELKSRGVEKIDSLRRQVSERGSLMKSSMRDGMNGQVTRMNTSMRTSPMLWAGVAAGAGFTLGMIGRYAQWRHKQYSRMPELVIIDAC